MWAPKNEKALFRIGKRVFHNMSPGQTFIVTAKTWNINGCICYTIANKVASLQEVLQKDLTKVV